MEKKVLLNDLVGRGTHIRTEVTPKVVIADGSHPKGEIWDANKVVSAISQDNQLDDSKFQAKLVSGTNIKTVDGYSVLGSGNIDIPGVQFGFLENGTLWANILHNLVVNPKNNKLYVDLNGFKLYAYMSGMFTEVSPNSNSVEQIMSEENKNFPVLFSAKDGDAGKSNTGSALKSNGMKYNPSTGNLQVTKINGVSADLTNYYTKSEVEALIAAALNPNSETPQEPVEQPGE